MTSHFVDAIEYYVTQTGSDDQECRSLMTSCLTVGRVMRDVSDGDVINIADDYNSPTSGGKRWPCRENGVINIGVSVSLIGLTTGSQRDDVTCDDIDGRLVVFNVTGSGSESVVRMRLERLTITDVAFLVRDSHVMFVNCTVIDSMFNAADEREDHEEEDCYIGLELVDTVWKTLRADTTGNDTREVCDYTHRLDVT